MKSRKFVLSILGLVIITIALFLGRIDNWNFIIALLSLVSGYNISNILEKKIDGKRPII